MHKQDRRVAHTHGKGGHRGVKRLSVLLTKRFIFCKRARGAVRLPINKQIKKRGRGKEQRGGNFSIGEKGESVKD